MNNVLPSRRALLSRRKTSAIALIGGQAVGAIGAVGSQYEGYTLSWGDDFDALDIVGPASPRGRYFTVRDYLSGPRGSDASLAPMYDTDPSHLGHNDANRGAPAGFNNMGVAGSVLTLQSRIASTPERAMFQGSGRYVLGAMISTTGAIQYYPDAAGTGDIILEARIKHSLGIAGWHPTFWSQAAEGANVAQYTTADEHDLEGSTSAASLSHVLWYGLTNQAGTGTAVNSNFVYDNAWHVWTFIFSKDPNKGVELYKDGTLFGRGVYNANVADKLSRALITSHVDTTASESNWAAAPAGTNMQVDWMRVWRRSSAPHYKPLVAVADQNIPFGGSTTFTIPDPTTLWGDGSVAEYLQWVMSEENEPGGTHNLAPNQFPAGVTYNAGTRVLTVAPTSAKAGRLNFVMAAKKAGCTVEPLRFSCNIGPVVNLSSVTYTVGTPISVDIYAACDCGVLVTDGVSKKKVISIAGLPAWASYSDVTGLLTGMPTDTGSTTSTITVTNSIGQSASAALFVTKYGTVTTFVTDSFTDTDGTALSAHTGEVGATWIKQPGITFANETLLSGGRIAAKTAGGSAYQASGNPPTADYQIDAVMDCLTVIASDTVGIIARASSTANTMYYARYVMGTGWQLYRVSAGSLTQLGSTVAGTFTAGTSHKLSLKVKGSQITLLVDDVSTIDVADGSPISAIGHIGVRSATVQGASTGLQITSINAQTLAAGALAISGTPDAATTGLNYNFAPAVTGGSGTRTFSMTGTLPDGLSFSTSTGAISGTPTTAGTYSGIGITVTDSSGSATLSGASIVVGAAVVTVGIGGTPGAATVGSAYSFVPTVTNGSGTKNFSLGGTLPAGLSFSTTTGAITGTPTAAGTTTGLSITVVDDSGTATLSGFSIAVAAGSGSYFLVDTFTDADGTTLNNHTGETGATWTHQSGVTFSTEAVINAGRISFKTAGGSAYQSSGTPPTADYQVDATLDCLTVIASDTVGITARASAAANSMYYARYVQGSGWQLYKINSGASTQIGSTVAGTFAAGTSRKLSLRVQGSTITLLVDDAVTITGTDTQITAAGKAGVRSSTVQATATGIQITSISAK